MWKQARKQGLFSISLPRDTLLNEASELLTAGHSQQIHNLCSAYLFRQLMERLVDDVLRLVRSSERPSQPWWASPMRRLPASFRVAASAQLPRLGASGPCGMGVCA